MALSLMDGRVAERSKAPVCKTGGNSLHRFESCPYHHLSESRLERAGFLIYAFNASVAAKQGMRSEIALKPGSHESS